MLMRRHIKDRWLSMPQRVVDTYVAVIALRCLASLPLAFVAFGGSAGALIIPCLFGVIAAIHFYWSGSDNALRWLLIASASYWASVATIMVVDSVNTLTVFGSLTIAGFLTAETLSLLVGSGEKK